MGCEIHFTTSNVGGGKQFWCQILASLILAKLDFVFILVLQKKI